MEDEDGTCLLDVLCDPQALNDFLHGTNELQAEDLLINSSSGEPSLFTDAPSPVSLLGDDRDSPDTPPPGCVDLSFLEEALLSSPEGGEDPQAVQDGPPVETGCEEKKREADEAGEVEVACDILQQSLQEAEITEQTMALEAGLAQTGDSLSLYSPAPLLSPPTLPFISKSVTLPVPSIVPRDTQAAVEPPQPSLLAVGPGCPSLKPAAPPQLMGLLPGNVFPAPSSDASFSLSPAQGSNMILHKAVPSVTSRPLITSTLRAAAVPAPGLVLQRAPLPIQPKLPISIQPRLVQITPKPSGQKPTPGLTFVPGTASSNILLSQAPGQKTVAQQQQQLSKPVSLQLVNQGSSFVLQPQGLFQGQNQFLLPGQSPVTIAQPARAAPPLLTPSHQGPPVHSMAPSAGQLVDSSQILTVPQRQLNFSPVFTTPTGQLALRQATVLSGHLQLQSAPATVFQMPAQLAGAYTPGGQGPQATLVHSPALGNHITLINSSGVLPPDLTSISIVNGPSVVQGLPFAAQAPPAPQAGVTEGQVSLQRASVVLLPERPVPDDRSSSEEPFHQLQQPFGHVVQHVSVRPASARLQSSPPPVVTVLQPPPEPPLAPNSAVEVPKLLMPPADMNQVLEEVTQSMSQNQDFMQHLQQRAPSSPVPSKLLVGALPVVPMEPLTSPVADSRKTQPQTGTVSEQEDHVVMSHQSDEVSPHPSDSENTPLICSPTQIQDSTRPASSAFSSPPGPEISVSQTSAPHIEPQVHYQVPHQLQVSFVETQVNVQSSVSQPPTQVLASVPQVQVQVSQHQASGCSSVRSSPSPLCPSISVPQQQTVLTAAPASLSNHGDNFAVHQLPQNKPTAALAVESKTFTLSVHPPSPAEPPAPVKGSSSQTNKQTGKKLADPVELQKEERLTPAVRRNRFQQHLCSDHRAVQNPLTNPPFTSLKDAVKCLLPYHTCAGHLPTQEDFNLVDWEFYTMSGFLLKRTKDMVNKYRQLLVKETQQESPSAEMVMLERLFLQAERFALTEDRRRARRDPETFLTALAMSTSSPNEAHSSGPSHFDSSSSPSSPPAWTQLSERPPGLKTYHSSSRGALRLTIKQESGSRKVIHNSACDPGLKRDHAGQLTNGGGGLNKCHPQATNGASQHPQHDEMSNGAFTKNTVDQVQQTTPDPKINPPNPLSMLEARDICFDLPPRDVSAPKLKCYRLDTSPQPELFSPTSPPLQKDNMLSEHLQSAIDSILELQRLQGTSVAPTRASSGPPLDQAVTSILEGHL
ncbi:BRD4-interacting chromatin-remodeling complex-associated protein isoform X2 [Kryptolebias marmoratus]|uniref:Si:ch211-168d23.3 n=1 Tax=Kryptolebias marmoratus TaxID=37003 RepID=A0A3Q3BD50_KRYMA|nr:BRD4-interacting chromatin-remodeling complex-associated protein isoform X2 [Kryptolebias marmoratus]